MINNQLFKAIIWKKSQNKNRNNCNSLWNNSKNKKYFNNNRNHKINHKINHKTNHKTNHKIIKSKHQSISMLKI